jgi:hypothetical protein
VPVTGFVCDVRVLTRGDVVDLVLVHSQLLARSDDVAVLLEVSCFCDICFQLYLE